MPGGFAPPTFPKNLSEPLAVHDLSNCMPLALEILTDLRLNSAFDESVAHSLSPNSATGGLTDRGDTDDSQCNHRQRPENCSGSEGKDAENICRAKMGVGVGKAPIR